MASTKYRLSDLDKLLAARAVNRQAARITSGGTPVDVPSDPQPAQPPRAPNFVEPPRRGVADRHAQVRERFAQRRAEFEAMDDEMLELEAVSLGDSLEKVRAELRAHHAGEGDRDHDWLRRAERAASVIKSELTLVSSEQRQRKQARLDAERQQIEMRKVRAADDRRQRWETQERLLREGRAAKEARIAAAQARHLEFAEAFIAQARSLLEPEIFQLLIEAAKQNVAS